MFRRSDPKKLAIWRERFQRFSSSGLAVERFCAREGVSTASFYHWRKKLGLKGRRRSATGGDPRLRTDLVDGRARFQQVAVVPGTSPVLETGPAICIQLPCGARIDVGTEDLDVLRTLVSEVVRARRPWETPGRADRGREAGGASC